MPLEPKQTDLTEVEDVNKAVAPAPVPVKKKQPAAQNKPMPRQAIDEYMAELDKLDNDPQYRRPDAPGKEDLQKAIADARAMYDKQTTINDWASAAERIGHAVTQMAAAQSGLKHGGDMSNLKFDKNDWEARQNRNFNEYKTNLDLAEKGYGQSAKESDYNSDADQEEYKKKRGTVLEKIKAEKDRLDAEEANKKDRDREAREGRRVSAAEARLELRDLDAQEKQLLKQQQAQQSLFNSMQQDGLSSKDKKKAQAKYAEQAARADIDLNALVDELDATNKPGMIYGTNPDEKARAGVLSKKSQEMKTLLDGIRKRKEELRKQVGQTEGGSQKQVAAPEAPGKTVNTQQISDYAKQYGMSEQAAAEYLQSQGYQVVK